MSAKVRLLSDPILRVRCEEVGAGDISGIQGLLDSMHDIMKSEHGMGLAANQIGHSVRVFILKNEESYVEFINPEIITQMGLTSFEGEGCLSIPGPSATTQRFEHVRLRWLDKESNAQEGEFSGTQAFAIQHEMDHLNGKLYIDQFGPVKQEMIVKKHRKFLKDSGR